ncbi:hypothetical protein QJS66_13050 [Kocuria rhizophila]|nr:hypothetical protein QJS66_13050 [Kocuria rhizophila]
MTENVHNAQNPSVGTGGGAGVRRVPARSSPCTWPTSPVPPSVAASRPCPPTSSARAAPGRFRRRRGAPRRHRAARVSRARSLWRSARLPGNASLEDAGPRGRRDRLQRLGSRPARRGQGLQPAQQGPARLHLPGPSPSTPGNLPGSSCACARGSTARWSRRTPRPRQT